MMSGVKQSVVEFRSTSREKRIRGTARLPAGSIANKLTGQVGSHARWSGDGGVHPGLGLGQRRKGRLRWRATKRRRAACQRMAGERCEEV